MKAGDRELKNILLRDDCQKTIIYTYLVICYSAYEFKELSRNLKNNDWKKLDIF